MEISTNIIEAILFAAGNAVPTDLLREKLDLTKAHDDIVGKVFFGCGEVFVFQLDTPSFFQAFVRLGGPATAQADGVQCAFGCVLFESMDDAVACSQQYDKHKDAPRHCKTGEERAQLVTLDCTVYFLPKVYHDYCK